MRRAKKIDKNAVVSKKEEAIEKKEKVITKKKKGFRIEDISE